MTKTVLVGFSGGVDSATSALLLREQGYRVRAAMMSVRDAAGHGCGVTGDTSAAEDLARSLDIPLTIVDCSAAYQEEVLAYFRREYLAGRTPNPCVRCNALIKFSLLPRLAAEAGEEFSFFATGHYARIEFRSDLHRHVLLRGTDRSKDQSYFLYRLSPDILARTLFPLGNLHKDTVRKMAAERGLPVHDKPDSQDFYAGEYTDLLGTGESEGNIVNLQGKVLGRHSGYWNFTPGQRKGLGVAFTEPLYVIRVLPEKNEVVAGTRTEQLRPGCIIDSLIFPGGIPAAGTKYTGRLRSAQPLRQMTAAGLAGPDGLMVLFGEPVHGVAPGQSLVLYDGDMVIGGGIIRESL